MLFQPYKAIKTELQNCKNERSQLRSVIEAIDSAIAVIEFEPDGTITNANQNFLSATGYQLNEIVGQHHRMMCLKQQAETTEYANFWRSLREGKAQKGEFERQNKAGEIIWLEATYFPVREHGRVTKVMKIAADITPKK